MELMFEIQQYGQIPAEIIKDIAPGSFYSCVHILLAQRCMMVGSGLKFDENGMPVMPNMGAGAMPEMPNQQGSGLPDLGDLSTAMQGGQCCIS